MISPRVAVVDGLRQPHRCDIPASAVWLADVLSRMEHVHDRSGQRDHTLIFAANRAVLRAGGGLGGAAERIYTGQDTAVWRSIQRGEANLSFGRARKPVPISPRAVDCIVAGPHRVPKVAVAGISLLARLIPDDATEYETRRIWADIQVAGCAKRQHLHDVPGRARCLRRGCAVATGYSDYRILDDLAVGVDQPLRVIGGPWTGGRMVRVVAPDQQIIG